MKVNSDLDDEAKAARAYDDVADGKMLSGIANGDRMAFRQLHDRYDGLLFTTINKVLNDQQDSEDVLQEVFAKLWRKAALYSPERGRPVTWLASMARNRAIDRLRSKQRRARLRDDLENEAGAEPDVSDSATAGDVNDAATRRDDCRVVRGAVLELTPDQREAIDLAFFHGMTQKEIAVRLGEPLGTVKARIRRGVQRLRRTVGTRLD